MKSVKPGRGPSGMKFIGSVFSIVFGIFWTIMAARMGAPAFFPIFGVIFIIMGIVQAAYNYKNATGKNRYSSFDITEDGEEPDPLEQRFGGTEYPTAAKVWTVTLNTAQSAARDCPNSSLDSLQR